MSPFTAEVASALRGPEWLRARRVAAAERLSGLSLPTESEEIWRYSRIGDLDLDAYSPTPDAAAAEDGASPVPAELEPVVRGAGPHSALAVVRNGRVTLSVVDPELQARGLVLADAADLPDGDQILGGLTGAGTGGGGADAFDELNDAFAPGAVVIRVPPGLEVELPIMVFHWTEGDQVASFPHTVVEAGADSGVTVVEHHASADVAAFVDPVVELTLGQAARARYLNIQDLGPRVWQVGHQVSDVGRDATLRSSVVALGGSYARVRTDSRITGQGGTTELTAVYFADGDRMHDFRTLQDHVGPSSTSDLLFKGAVQDRGRSVYSGLIRVNKTARGTNAFQTNRNLVLSEGAEASSVPNLEIDTDDVRCSHASSVGPIDEEHRYYLESRGVPPDVAERLIVLGFFNEVLERLPAPSFAGAIRATLARRLAATGTSVGGPGGA